MMTDNQRFRITLMQLSQQAPQCILLRRRSRVHRALAVGSKSADIAHPYGMTVMVSAMSTDNSLRSSDFDAPVNRNHIMIAASVPAQRPVPAVYVSHPKGTARLVGGAVHDNKSNCSHNKY